MRRAITNGFLAARADGSLDPVLVGTGWCSRNRRRADGANIGANTGANTAPPVRTELLTPEAAQAPTSATVELEPQPHGGGLKRSRRIPEDGEEPVDPELAIGMVRGGRATLAEAERIKANALALKQHLDAQRLAGELIEIESAEELFFSVGRAERDSWLNWPARIGPLVAADLGLSADRVTEVLTAHVHRHLEELGEPEFEVGNGSV